MSGTDELQIDVTDAEILADLSWPGPPPGDWAVETEESEPNRDELGLRLEAAA